MDNTLVIDLDDEEYKYMNMILSKYNIDLETLLHKIFNWCFHSTYFWDSIKKNYMAY